MKKLMKIGDLYLITGGRFAGITLEYLGCSLSSGMPHAGVVVKGSNPIYPSLKGTKLNFGHRDDRIIRDPSCIIREFLK